MDNMRFYRESMNDAAFWRKLWKIGNFFSRSTLHDLMMRSYTRAMEYKRDALTYK